MNIIFKLRAVYVTFLNSSLLSPSCAHNLVKKSKRVKVKGKGKGKGKVFPLQARCGPEVGKKYSSTLPWPRH